VTATRAGGVPEHWAADANHLKELTGDADSRGTQQEALAVLLELDFLQPVEIAQDVAPFGGNPVPVEPIFEFLGEQERGERSRILGREWPCPCCV
jgi:hypothetical protein